MKHAPITYSSTLLTCCNERLTLARSLAADGHRCRGALLIFWAGISEKLRLCCVASSMIGLDSEEPRCMNK